MNHAITVGELLRVLAVIVAILAAVGGFLMAIAGGFIPAPGPKDERNSKIGCIVFIVAIVGIALLLTGCGTTAAVQTRTVQVDVPVAVHPIDPKKIPTPPPPLGKRPETAPQAADKAFSGWCAAVAYIIRAVPLLDAGAGLPPGQAPDYPECKKH